MARRREIRVGETRQARVASEVEANRRNWEARVDTHVASAFYDVEGFVRSRKPRLDAIALAEVGDVAGKDLLHLQCHIGIDTLSWALLGARVTGVDFSPAALRVGRDLAGRLGIDADFVESDVSAVDLDRRYDVVFASHGVLCWVPDIHRWVQTAARHLRPGGYLYVLDGHPVAQLFDADDPHVNHLRVHPEQHYFRRQPRRSVWDGTYVDSEARLPHPVTYQWMHPIGEIVQATRDAGLDVELLHEFPVDVWRRFPFMTHDGEWWRISGDPIPLLFSLRARRVA